MDPFSLGLLAALGACLWVLHQMDRQHRKKHQADIDRIQALYDQIKGVERDA